MRFSAVLLIFGLLSLSLVARAQEVASAPQENRPEVKSIEQKQVSLYPNPAVETVTVKFDQPQTAKVKLTLHNIIGNVIDVETEVLDEYEIRLKVKDLPSGYYLLAIRNDDSGFKGTFKLLKR